MRTQDEIVGVVRERIREPFDFSSEVLVPYLDRDRARAFLNDDYDMSDWTTRVQGEDAVRADASEYMEFAWGKVRNHRGLSAGRSVDKMWAWCWLLGKEQAIDWDNYAPYGAPILRQVCEVLGFSIPDDERLVRMMSGQPCGANYDCGCNR